jgi:hypothetical protein
MYLEEVTDLYIYMHIKLLILLPNADRDIPTYIILHEQKFKNISIKFKMFVYKLM